MTAEEIYEEICNETKSKQQEEGEGNSFDDHVNENHIISSKRFRKGCKTFDITKHYSQISYGTNRL